MLVESKSWTDVKRATAGDLNRAAVVVGGRTSATGGFGGTIDDIVIFDTAPTPEQSAALHDGDRDGVQGAWPLYEDIAEDGAVDAMGRYALNRVASGLVDVVSGLQPHDVLDAGARSFVGTPVSAPGTSGWVNRERRRGSSAGPT